MSQLIIPVYHLLIELCVKIRLPSRIQISDVTSIVKQQPINTVRYQTDFKIRTLF